MVGRTHPTKQEDGGASPTLRSMANLSVMERVRKALGRSGPLATPPVPPEIKEPVTRLVHSEIGLPELFAKRAAVNKMHVDTVGADAVAGAIASFFVAKGLRRIAMPVSEALERLGVRAAMEEAGLEVK